MTKLTKLLSLLFAMALVYAGLGPLATGWAMIRQRRRPGPSWETTQQGESPRRRSSLRNLGG